MIKLPMKGLNNYSNFKNKKRGVKKNGRRFNI